MTPETASISVAPSPVPVPDAMIEKLLSAPRVVIVSHVKPDGDAFGSTLALAHLLQNAGRNAIVVGLEPVAPSYQFLTQTQPILPAAEYLPQEGDLFAVCDCGSPDRLPGPLQVFLEKLPSVSIDHHKTNSGFGDVSYVDPSASSTAELIWRIARKAGWPLDQASATALWVGVVTDTGRFAYDNTTPETLEFAADLLRQGQLSTAEVNEQVYGNVPEAQLRLQARAIDSLQRSPDGRVALISLARSDYDACGAAGTDSENFVNLPRSLRGVTVAGLLYEGDQPDQTRLSLRSRPPYDASLFCSRHGGGGHARAAGATLDIPISEARQSILRELTAWLDSHI